MKALLKAFSIFWITFFLAVSYGVHVSIAASDDSPWQMFRHDLRHTGASPFKGAQANKLKWKFEV